MSTSVKDISENATIYVPAVAVLKEKVHDHQQLRTDVPDIQYDAMAVIYCNLK